MKLSIFLLSLSLAANCQILTPILTTAVAGGGGATFSQAQAPVTGTSTSGTAITATLASAIGAGNAIIAVVGYTSTGRTNTMSGTGWTWTLLAGPGTGSRIGWIYLGTGGTGTAITATLSGSIATRLNIYVAEWHRTSGSWTQDAGTCTTNSDCTDNGNSGTASTASFTPTSSIPEIIYSMSSNGGTASGTSAGWTDETSPQGSFAIAYRNESSTTGSYSRNWTIAASNTWDTTIAGVK